MPVSPLRVRRPRLPHADSTDPVASGAMHLTAWLALLLAGLLEIAWALGLKYSDGLTRVWPSVGMLMAIALSFALLGGTEVAFLWNRLCRLDRDRRRRNDDHRHGGVRRIGERVARDLPQFDNCRDGRP